LPISDGERVVVVSLRAVGVGDEVVTRDLAHGSENALLANAAIAKLLIDHAEAAFSEMVRKHRVSVSFWEGKCKDVGWVLK
jgi:hypothetical protein